MSSVIELAQRFKFDCIQQLDNTEFDCQFCQYYTPLITLGIVDVCVRSSFVTITT